MQIHDIPRSRFESWRTKKSIVVGPPSVSSLVSSSITTVTPAAAAVDTGGVDWQRATMAHPCEQKSAMSSCGEELRKAPEETITQICNNAGAPEQTDTRCRKGPNGASLGGGSYAPRIILDATVWSS